MQWPAARGGGWQVRGANDDVRDRRRGAFDPLHGVAGRPRRRPAAGVPHRRRRCGMSGLKDQVAIVSAATTGFTPRNTERSQASYALEASIAAIRDAGLTAADIDGICGTTPDAAYMQF